MSMQETYDDADILLLRHALNSTVHEHRNFIALEGGDVSEDFKINAEIATKPNGGVLLTVNVQDAPLSPEVAEDINRYFVELSDSFRRAGFKKEGDKTLDKGSPVSQKINHAWSAESMLACERQFSLMYDIIGLKSLTRLAAMHPQGMAVGVEKVGKTYGKGLALDKRKAIRAELAAYRLRHAMHTCG